MLQWQSVSTLSMSESPRRPIRVAPTTHLLRWLRFLFLHASLYTCLMFISGFPSTTTFTFVTFDYCSFETYTKWPVWMACMISIAMVAEEAHHTVYLHVIIMYIYLLFLWSEFWCYNDDEINYIYLILTLSHLSLHHCKVCYAPELTRLGWSADDLIACHIVETHDG